MLYFTSKDDTNPCETIVWISLPETIGVKIRQTRTIWITISGQRCWRPVTASGGSKNFEKVEAEDSLSAPSSFISNARNEIYAFYT